MRRGPVVGTRSLSLTRVKQHLFNVTSFRLSNDIILKSTTNSGLLLLYGENNMP